MLVNKNKRNRNSLPPQKKKRNIKKNKWSKNQLCITIDNICCILTQCQVPWIIPFKAHNNIIRTGNIKYLNFQAQEMKS